MYIPNHFAQEDRKKLISFIQRYPFATMFTGNTLRSDDFEVSHIPFSVKSDANNNLLLVGHLAKANTHCQFLERGDNTLVVFKGPHSYISPTLYAKPNQAVPTWNYTVVHAYGKSAIISDRNVIMEHLADLERIYEGNDGRWSISMLEKVRIDNLVNALSVFQIQVDKLQGKFKLGQNKSAEDYSRVKSNLLDSGNQTQQDLGEIMKQWKA